MLVLVFKLKKITLDKISSGFLKIETGDTVYHELRRMVQVEFVMFLLMMFTVVSFMNSVIFTVSFHTCQYFIYMLNIGVL